MGREGLTASQVCDIEVIAGLKGGKTAIVHPGDDLPAGTAVEPLLLKQ